MSKTPKTDRLSEVHPRGCIWPSDARLFEEAGNALHERLEHWISMNSGVCDPKDVEAIENWKKAIQ